MKAVAVTASALAFGAISMPAAAQGNPALGALIGGGVGAAIGQSVNGRNGALVGAAVGALAGASIAANAGRGYTVAAPVPAYYLPPHPRPSPYVVAAPVYRAAPAVRYRPAPVYVAAPVVVYAPHPAYVVQPYPVTYRGGKYPAVRWQHERHGRQAVVRPYPMPR